MIIRLEGSESQLKVVEETLGSHPRNSLRWRENGHFMAQMLQAGGQPQDAGGRSAPFSSIQNPRI
jgi:hypothetical protein